tara:strand:- start:417 stop:1688 length:1272 start_codon:yes stop_codon:yes gene_type:complete
MQSKQKIAIIGLGYVGLPLALAFSKKFRVLGYDISKKRVTDLKKGFDKNHEFKKNILLKNKNLSFTFNDDDLNYQDIFIITAPTPLKKRNLPDLTPLKSAIKIVAKKMKKNSTIIIESTVYPGATEEVCIPIIEKFSKLKLNKSFFCAYSPERINPGDKKKTLENIKKIVSASNHYTLKKISKLYKSIIKAGIFEAKSIKVAEAAKVIENTQRDLNIALINELSFLFSKLNIETKEVLDAASTKWNFLKFQPGLVGGHCVSVDPYYLTFKSKKAGYNPKIILSGRNVNNSVAKFIFERTKELMKKKRISLKKSKILIAGFAFKNDCSDCRNTKVFDIYKNFKKYVSTIDIFDPLVNSEDVYKEYKLQTINYPKKNFYDAVILAVDHKFFKRKKIQFFKNFLKRKSIIFDIKNIFSTENTDLRL